MPILSRDRLDKISSFPLLQTSWHYLAAATLSACNEPDEVATLYLYFLEQRGAIEKIETNDKTETNDTDNHALHGTRQFRESLFKSSSITGMPRSINALVSLSSVTPADCREAAVLRSSTSSDGDALFSRLYGKVSARVYGQLQTAYPDLAQYAVRQVYGALLSFDEILGPRETSLVVIAALVPLDVNPQLKGHLKGAINNGASVQEVRQARELAILISEWCGVVWKQEVVTL